MKVQDLMTREPVAMTAETTLAEAAAHMRDHEIGDVLITEGGGLIGIVTDRDIIVRAIASGGDPSKTTLGDVCTPEPATIQPDDDFQDALAVMAARAVRRLPVVDNGHVVGVLTLNDIAGNADVGEVTAKIAAAAPNDQTGPASTQLF